MAGTLGREKTTSQPPIPGLKKIAQYLFGSNPTKKRTENLILFKRKRWMHPRKRKTDPIHLKATVVFR